MFLAAEKCSLAVVGRMARSSPGIDEDESTVLFLVGVGTMCFTFCKSIYYAFSIPTSQVKIHLSALKKKRKGCLYMIVDNLAVVRSGVISS